MKRMKIACAVAAIVLMTGTCALQAAVYALDNGSVGNALNASEGTETLDNWFGNVYTVVPGANTINGIDYGLLDTTAGTTSDLVIYRVTGAGGNPALGATRIYTQAFTPLTGDRTNVFLQHINLTTPVTFNSGDVFLVAVFTPNVIAGPVNVSDVYPYLIDNNALTSAGSYWDRALPNTFNLDNISGAVVLTTALTPGGFTPGPGHLILRADAVPEPSAFAFAGIGALALMLFQRRK